MFPYDAVHQTFINVFETEQLAWQTLLRRDFTQTDYLVGTRQSTLDVILKFVPSGVHHILIGPDHILFLVGLLLVGGSVRQLLLVVTAFTFAHSITLSLAALEILTPPAEVIEPAIALSIVYVGAENILKKGGRDTRVWVALIFGLIHGFGFANVLRDMGLPSSALAAALFSFNVGVEIGQLFVVAIVATAITALRARSERAGRQLAFAGSIVVLIAGAYWFFERAFFSGARLT
jgi:hydrogenase/urease accessory protein HupE